MIFCLVTLHLWGLIFSELEVLVYTDDDSIMGPLSKVLEVISELNPFFKRDADFDFNLDKTKILTKGTTTQHVFDRTQFSSRIIPIFKKFLTISPLTCSRSRSSNYLDHLWSTTSTSRIMWIKTTSSVSR